MKLFFKKYLLLALLSLVTLNSFSQNENLQRKVIFSNEVLQTETTQWLSVLPQRPSNRTISAVNNFIKAAKSNGYFYLLDRFWLFAQDIQTNAVYSIVNPTSTTCTEVNAPTFLAYNGFDFNGTSQYLNTNYTPSTNGVNYTLNNASHGVYCNENVGGTFGWDMGLQDASNASTISLRDNTNTCYAKVNNAVANFVSGANSNSIGLFNVVRSGVNTISIYINGVSTYSDTDVSTSLPTRPFFLGAYNNNGTAGSYVTRNLCISFVGSGSINFGLLNSDIITYLKTPLGF